MSFAMSTRDNNWICAAQPFLMFCQNRSIRPTISCRKSSALSNLPPIHIINTNVNVNIQNSRYLAEYESVMQYASIHEVNWRHWTEH